MHKDVHSDCNGIQRQVSQSGLTLIEVLVAMVVVVILATVGVPAFTQQLVRAELQSTALAIRQALHVARSEAVKRNGRVHLCSLATRAQVCAGHNGSGRKIWPHGILVFFDANQNRRFDIRVDHILYQAEFTDQLTVEWARGDYLAYAGTGRLQFSNGTFRISAVDMPMARHLILSRAGRLRSESF